jgi:hypothetical protein
LEGGDDDDSDRHIHHDQLEAPSGDAGRRQQVDDKSRRLALARKFASQGWLSKAFNMLSRKPLPLVNDDTLNEILQKFPRGDLVALPKLPDNANPLIIDAGSLGQAIKQLGKNGKAAGPSYFYPKLFSVFLDDPHLLQMYSEALGKLVNSTDLRSPDLIALILGGRVIAPIKKEAIGSSLPTHRTIIHSEAVLNHIMHVAMQQLPKEGIRARLKDYRNCLIQMGVAVPAGVEKAYRKIETPLLMAVDYGLSHVALGIDVVDAFQTLKRDDIMSAFYEDSFYKPLWMVVDISFSNPAPRYNEMENGEGLFESKRRGMVKDG